MIEARHTSVPSAHRQVTGEGKGKAAEGSLLPEEGGSGRLVNSPVTVIWAGCPGGALSAFVNILPAGVRPNHSRHYSTKSAA